MNTQDLLKALIGNISETRRYGATYIRVATRNDCEWPFDCIHGARLNGEPVRLSYSSYGRSLEHGGHKYKAHANYRSNGKPVPSKRLPEITAG